MLKYLILFLVLLSGAAQAEPLVDGNTIPAPYTLAAKDVEQAVATALTGAGAGDHLSVDMVGQHARIYESQAPVTPRITSLSADKASGRWQANLMVMAQNGNVLTAMPIAGRFQEMTTLPILKRSLRSGDVIAKEDIDYLDFPVARTRTDVVSDINQLIGQAARNGISAHRPVRVSELATPAILKKSAVVQMIYRSGALEITTTGQALTQGAKGDVIEVRNLNSHQTIRAVVESSNVVSILPVGVAHAEN